VRWDRCGRCRIAAAVAGTTVERLQHLLTDADWDPVALDQERTGQMVEASPAGGVLAIGDTTFPKKGKHSVGVTHQYCGELGKRANCQAFVTAECTHEGPTSSTPLHWPVSGRLFLPNDWVSDEERRRRAHVPVEIEKQSKIGIALALIDRAILWNVPFRLVTADAAYEHFRDLLEGVEERKLVYACAVKCNFGVRRPDEVRAAQNVPPPSRKGTFGWKPKRHPALPYRVDEAVAELPEKTWKTITWREGSKGPMCRRFLAIRMHWGKGNQTLSLDDHRIKTSEEGGLIAERLPDGNGETETKHYFSNLPAKTSLKELATSVRSRWLIEQFYLSSSSDADVDSAKTTNSSAAWATSRAAVGTDPAATWLQRMLSYSFLALTRWQARLGTTLPTLPEVHRQVLLALLTDLVQRWEEAKPATLAGPFASLLGRAPPRNHPLTK
jgi:SRSO17 transposase